MADGRDGLESVPYVAAANEGDGRVGEPGWD